MKKLQSIWKPIIICFFLIDGEYIIIGEFLSLQ